MSLTQQSHTSWTKLTSYSSAQKLSSNLGVLSMRPVVTKLPSLRNMRTSRFTPLQKGSRSRWIHLTIFPVYSLSFKFRRLFPLSQYDLPTHGPGVLPFPRHVPEAPPVPVINEQPSDNKLDDAVSPAGTDTGSWKRKSMSAEQVALNPEVDYTK